MKSTKMLTILTIGLMTWMAGFSQAAKMGTAWTYQGRLIDANYPADGLYDFQFKLFDANVVGTQQESTITVNEADVIDGYFTVELDFGSDVFDGSQRWLQIEVRAGKLEDPSPYTPLNPRRQITPAPYALQIRGIFVDNAGNVGIGNTSPASLLDVKGDIRINAIKNNFPILDIDSTGDIEFKINAEDNPGKFSFFELFNGKGTNLWSVNEDGIMRVSGDSFLLGNVAIGTTAPSSKLHIEDNTTGDLIMKIHNLNNTGSERLYFGTSTGIDAGMIVWGSNNANYPGKWRFFNNKTSANYDWIAGSSVKMTLDNDGKLGIGNDSPTGKLDVRSSSELATAEIRNSRSSDIAYGVNAVANGSGGLKHYAGRFSASGATENFSIYADGINSKSYFGGNVGIETKTPSYTLHVIGSAAKTTGTYWTNISDRRLKENIKPLEGALDRLTRLKGRTFKWKNPAELNATEGT
ncbi:MAG: tail fiber domain-containing protein, partial [Planctomycetota bacterium]